MSSIAEKFTRAFGLCLCTAAPVSAAEWSVAPDFAWDADHHSNRTLREGGRESQSVSAGLDLRLARETETGRFELVPHVLARRFSNDVMPKADDTKLLALANHQFERASFAVNAELADESTLTTELDTTGVIRADASRHTQAAGVSWEFVHAAERRFGVSASYQDVEYTGAYTGRLFGYRYAAASATETFTLSERLSFQVTGFASGLDSAQRDSRSREYGAGVGVSFALSENTAVSATVGASERDVGDATSRGMTGDLSVTHRGERSEWNLGYSRSLQPFGSGVLTERDVAQAVALRDFAPRLRGLVRLNYSRNSDAGAGLTFDERTYRSADLELRWQIKETWSLAAVAGYANADDLEPLNSGESWSVALRSRWTPSPRVIGH